MVGVAATGGGHTAAAPEELLADEVEPLLEEELVLEDELPLPVELLPDEELVELLELPELPELLELPLDDISPELPPPVAVTASPPHAANSSEATAAVAAMKP